jgi:hypothetical protein
MSAPGRRFKAQGAPEGAIILRIVRKVFPRRAITQRNSTLHHTAGMLALVMERSGSPDPFSLWIASENRFRVIRAQQLCHT